MTSSWVRGACPNGFTTRNSAQRAAQTASSPIEKREASAARSPSPRFQLLLPLLPQEGEDKSELALPQLLSLLLQASGCSKRSRCKAARKRGVRRTWSCVVTTSDPILGSSAGFAGASLGGGFGRGGVPLRGKPSPQMGLFQQPVRCRREWLGRGGAGPDLLPARTLREYKRPRPQGLRSLRKDTGCGVCVLLK